MELKEIINIIMESYQNNEIKQLIYFKRNKWHNVLYINKDKEYALKWYKRDDNKDIILNAIDILADDYEIIMEDDWNKYMREQRKNNKVYK